MCEMRCGPVGHFYAELAGLGLDLAHQLGVHRGSSVLSEEADDLIVEEITGESVLGGLAQLGNDSVHGLIHTGNLLYLNLKALIRLWFRRIKYLILYIP